jgi:O-antigen ligase
MRRGIISTTFIHRFVGALLVVNIYTTNLVRIRFSSPIFYFFLVIGLMYIMFDNIRLHLSTIELTLFLLPITYLILNLLYTYDLFASFRFLVYFSLFLLIQLYLNRSNAWHEVALKYIYILSLLLVFFTYIQYLFPDFYFANVLPIFTPEEREIVLWLHAEHGMVGLTNQTGYNAFLMNLGLIVLLNKLLASKKSVFNFKKLTMFFLSIVYVVAIILLAQKRSFIFVIVIEVIVLLFAKYEILKKIKYNRLFRTLFLVVLVIFIALAPIFLKNLLVTLSDKYDSIDDFLSGRINIYKVGLSMFQSNYILGYGMASTPVFLEAEHGMQFQQMHNIYLQILAELGVVGFVIFTGLFVFYFNLTLKMIRAHRNSGERNSMTHLLTSLLVQTSWLVYGMSGNTLTVTNQLLVYIVFCSVPAYYAKQAGKTTSESIFPVNPLASKLRV